MSAPSWRDDEREHFPSWTPALRQRTSLFTARRRCTGAGCGRVVRVIEGQRTSCPRCRSTVTFSSPRTP